MNTLAAESEYTPIKSRFKKSPENDEEGVIKEKPVDPNDPCVLDLGRGPVLWGRYDDFGIPIMRRCPKCKKENPGGYALKGICHACEFDIAHYLAFGEELHEDKHPVIF